MVVQVAGGLRWLAASLFDTVAGVGFAGGAVALALRSKGVRLAVQPVVDFCHASPVIAVAVLLGAPWVGVAVYQGLSVLLLGGTLGQRLLGLRVVRLQDGAKPGFLRIVLRAVVVAGGTVALFAGPLYGVLLDKRRRGIGDVLARTVVARRAPRASGLGGER